GAVAAAQSSVLLELEEGPFVLLGRPAADDLMCHVCSFSSPPMTLPLLSSTFMTLPSMVAVAALLNHGSTPEQAFCVVMNESMTISSSSTSHVVAITLQPSEPSRDPSSRNSRWGSPASGEVHLPTGSTAASPLAEADSEASLADGEFGSLGSTPVSQAASGSVSAAAAIPSASLDTVREAARVRSEMWFGMPR